MKKYTKQEDTLSIFLSIYILFLIMWKAVRNNTNRFVDFGNETKVGCRQKNKTVC